MYVFGLVSVKEKPKSVVWDDLSIMSCSTMF